MDASRRRTRWSAVIAFWFGLLLVPAQDWAQQSSYNSDFLHFNNPYAESSESNTAPTGLSWAVPGSPSLPTGSSAISSNVDLEVTWRTLPKKFLSDQKDMWLFPGQLAKGRHWLPTILLVGGTAVLITQDPAMERAVRQSSAFGTFSNVLSSANTDAIIAGVPAAWYLESLLIKNRYGQSTALLAGEAVANDAVLMTVLKAATQRARPSEFPPNGPYNDTFWNSHNSFFGKGTSFPSGHAMMSFSIATVFSRRYAKHKWVPILAYTVASAISFSRITTASHFPSDVFLGAGLGFVVARFDVLRGN